MDTKNKDSVKVLISLPGGIHKALKTEAIWKKNGSNGKMNLEKVLIQRLERDLKAFPISIAL